MTSRISMRDVARRAGVSQKTVSRVVNDEPHVSPELRARVRREIELLGYRPNTFARALVTRRSRRIGLISTGSGYFGPASLLSGLQRAAHAEGYDVSVIHADEHDPEEAGRAVWQLVGHGIDGIALCGPIGSADIARHIPREIPVLRVDLPEDPAGPAETDGHRVLWVGNDDITAATEATAHLLRLGHRTVHHLAGPPRWAVTGYRQRGWRTALELAGAPRPEARHGDWSPASGYRATRELLQDGGVTALFAANDQMAIGAVHAIERSGRRVPEDVSVIGFDDIPEAGYLSVPLTTVRQDFARIAREGMHRLVAAIGHTTGPGTDAAPAGLAIPAELVHRASTAPPPAPPTA
ncbi:LacI family DNA-binding transcriptional regulator [Streptomyces harbinensis]|uniref:DNA-binding transcriptional regulator, LacI/PurR family n=1 Tax=Streptomyces harbinensis TaxID=1176198 RepID=A0A1I6U933_9ACTN|nr:LacI family DNA-binding transcriptional regulator [Streptomyces harbinensis]SFS97950.1 DNA-binding transcriptional regulator, LacI/PurR family [Streptomyces harbinensis]